VKFSRGAVLAETALFVSAALLFMLGTIQIGVIGFLQVTSDSAAYFDARANVLGVGSGTPEQATHVYFGQIPVPDISATVIPAPTPTIPVDYGYNDPDATVRANSAFQRHGGASMLQPAAEQATVKVPGLIKILGQGLGVDSVASSESLWQECGTHFDIANVGCSLSSPPPNSQTNYFSQGENTPPYMVGFNYMEQCTLGSPWGYYTGTNGASPVTAHGYTLGGSFNESGAPQYNYWNSNGPCSTSANNGNGNLAYIAMGTAEFLHSANWGNSGHGSGANGSGISGPCDTAGSGSNGQEASDQSVFCAIWWHQRVYADLAQYFAKYPYQYYPELYSQAYDYSAPAGFKANPANQFGAELSSTNSTTYTAFGNLITLAGFGNGTDAGKVATPETILTFEDWEGFDDPNYGPGYDSGLVSPATPDRWNKDVQTIYSWDVPVSAGDPPSDPTYNNPTNPLNGCC
jgi:hypothetical protein